MNKIFLFPVVFILSVLFSVKINAQTDTLVLQPGPADGYDAYVRTDSPDQNFGDGFDFIANAWTAQGNFFIMRSFILFNLSSIPSNMTVLNATLDLYTNLNTGHYQLDSGPNTAYFMRVTEAWSEHQVTWNHQPAATFDNLVILPQSTSHTETYHVDLTSHVQDMVRHPETNFGWMFRLQTEETYRCMVFASSDNPNASWHPRLTVIYTHCALPQAKFTFSIVDKTVQFTDMSLNANAWNWDFGDGSTSILQNPQHTYLLPGDYPVKLTVKDSCGTGYYIDTVHIDCVHPVADFEYHIYYPEVDFYNTTISNTAYAWLWNFGDGSTSTQKNPVHTYSYNGNYKVCMKVTDSCSTDSVCHDVHFNPPWNVHFTSGLIYLNGLVVRFTDNTEGATEWLWSFGDGDSSALQCPVHAYKLAGRYHVCLKAGNDISCDTACDFILLTGGLQTDTASPTAIYPNPVTDGIIYIIIGEDAEIAHIFLYNNLGKMVSQEQFSNVKKSEPIVETLPDLQGGIYFLKLQFNNITRLFKVIIP